MQVGLNFADVFTVLGLYAASPKADVTPGLEVMNPSMLNKAKPAMTMGIDLKEQIRLRSIRLKTIGEASFPSWIER